MNKTLKYIEHFLNETIYLLPYFLMGVSFLSILIPWLGFKFDFVTWGNGGGFSIICDVLFVKFFYFNLRYCWLTRHLPFSMILINIINIIQREFFPEHHELYSQIYEVVIFSITLFIGIYIELNKRFKRW